jgi:hypothetical protein
VADRLRLPPRERERNRDVAEEDLIRHPLYEVASLIRKRQYVRGSSMPRIGGSSRTRRHR